MGRGGAQKDRSAGPTRKCIATGEILPQSQMVRFAVGPERQIVPDILGRLPGRGIWVKADRQALEVAVSKRLFSRGAKAQVTIPDGLVETVETQLLERVVSLLALARKAGEAVAGFEKVKGWLLSGQGRVLIQANDGSARGKTKLRPPEGADGFIGCLSASEMGLAFGRDSVIHGALSAGGLATRVVEEATRLSGVREIDGGDVPTGKGTKNA